ncbi:MAG: D-alanine--D-alanine ligase [Myxococcales bacterium]|nr:D-alanine--D-alanine ligase [Myxococcales bacterium]
MSKTPVVILFGGRSSEHEISLLSARNVLLALDRERYEPRAVSIDKQGRWRLETEAFLLAATGDPRTLRLPADSPTLPVPVYPQTEGPFAPGTVVFSTLHGTFGEDGRVQGLLDMANVAYVGSGALGSALGMDKDVAKRLLTQAEIPVVPWQTLHAPAFRADPEGVAARAAALAYPLFVKPANAGSSVGVTKVPAPHALAAALERAFRYDTKVLVEAAVNAREVECAVLGNEAPEASTLGEVVVTHKDGFYSYEAKYLDPSGAHLVIPAPLPDEVSALIRDLSVRAFQVLELSGLARVDFFVEQGTLEVYLNEVNTLPGFTAISMYPKMWEASGLSQKALVTRLIELARERHAVRSRLETSFV